ncbi:hypothetical protein GCM10025859_02320 [Alicyclobacillus fastidiosus]|nr:hypothetical protein GCM10025859_02320 [Alicyclobacillus fastidiosus]
MENEHPSETQSFWQQFFGPNFGYILELYESYRENPESVSADTRALFATYGDPNTALSLRVQSTQTGQAPFSVSPERIAQVIDLARSIRVHGHLAAATDPLHPKGSVPQLETSTHGIGDADLSELPASVVLRDAPADVRSARDAIDRLRQAYCGRHGYEFQHLTDETEIAWLQQQVESGRLFAPLSSDEKKELYASLAKTELFEKFMHRRFVGQKRFSVEGLDALVPVVQKVTDSALEQGISTVVIGMAHRGRLNVLAHVVQKPYERIFRSFTQATTLPARKRCRSTSSGGAVTSNTTKVGAMSFRRRTAVSLASS